MLFFTILLLSFSQDLLLRDSFETSWAEKGLQAISFREKESSCHDLQMT